MKTIRKTNSFQSSLSSSRNLRSSLIFPSDSISINDIQSRNQQSINDLIKDDIHLQRISSQRSRKKSFSSLKSIHENDLTNHVSIKFIPKHPFLHQDQLEKQLNEQQNQRKEQLSLENTINYQFDEYQLFHFNFVLFFSSKFYFYFSIRNYLWRHCDRTRCFQLLGCCFTIFAVSLAIAAIIFALLAYRSY